MTGKELFTYLTQDAGLDDATAQAIMKAAENEKVAKKAADFVRMQEYKELETKAAELELSLNGNGSKPGSKTYEKWYADNYPAIVELQRKAQVYEERFGPLEAAAPKGGAPAGGGGATFKPEDIQKIVNETIQQNYAPRWGALLTGTGEIVQRHIRNGRKTNIDFKKLEEIANTKNGDLLAAYEEYDRPEAEAAQKTAQEAEIKRRVDEEVAKRQTQQFFPAGADASPSSGGIGRSAAKEKYDRNAVIGAAVTGKYDGAKESVQ